MVFHKHASRVLALLGLMASVACGWQVQDIDRTQPDKVRKDIFTDGKPWYFRQTIIDLPATTDLSFIGEQGQTHKVIWQIDEKFLYAYRAHEQLVGGEEYAARPGVPYRGTPIAAFAILSHFDIQRDYNAQTGEQTNVINENTNDRPWYEREYMRVDWSNNLITDFQFSGASVTQQPVARYVREGENSKDAAKITANYVDVVHELVAEPEIHPWLSAYWGMPVPMCWLYSNIYTDCLGSRVKVRSSFMKVPEDNVYEPLQFDDHKFAKFGYFRLDRYGYDRHYGIIDPKVSMLIERFNIWKRAPGEPDCKDDSLEHPWANCSNERIKPIVYYVNEEFPDRLKNGARRIGDEWNDVFKEAVSAMTGRPKSQLPDVFIACLNNPVQEGDRAECGQPGLSPQSGDLRYNMMYYVTGAQKSSPLGYGPHAIDSETGEVISANAYLYGAALETYTQYALDFAKLQNGTLSVDDFYDGANISKHYEGVRAMREQTELRVEPEVLKRAAEGLGIKHKAAQLREKVRNGQLMTDEIPGRLEAIRGTPLEGVFFNEDMRRAMAPQFENATDVPAAYRRFLSPATLHDPVFMRLGAEREFKLSRATVDMAEFFDDGMAGWARRLKCQDQNDPVYGRICRDVGVLDEQAAYDWMLEEIFVGVELHEVGHNVGLRHNFAATSDAINFFQDFERDADGNIVVDETTGQPKMLKGYWLLRSLTLGAGTRTLKPEFNLTSNAEINGLNAALEQGLREYQYASIMDYGSKPNSDVHGLGLYDRAAIKYGYGLMVDVFDRTATDPAQIRRDDAHLLQPIARHYTVYPDLISGNDNYTYDQRVAAMYKRKTVKESEVQVNMSLVEVPYRFCSDEYHNSSYFCYRFDQGADAYEQVRNNAAMYENYYVFNGMRRNRVGFGMDLFGYISRVYGRYFEFLSAQNKHFLNDNLINRFNDPGCEEGIHFVDAKCGLDRFAASLESANALGRVLQTPEPGCYIRKKPGCYLESFDDVNNVPAQNTRMDDSFCDNPPANPGGTVVRVEATDPYVHIEDSVSCEQWRPMLTAGDESVWEPAVEIPLGVGRFALDKYNREMYGYGFYWKPVTIGSWWDKWLAMQALGDPYTEFIGVDSRGDSRSYLISYNNLFRNQVQNFVGGFITEDFKQYSPFVVPNGNEMVLRYQELVPTFANALQGRPPAELPSNAITLNPDDQYMARLQAMFIGAAFYSQITDDQDFNESMLIGKAGSIVDVTVPAEIKADPDRYVELTDPVSGHIYYAVKQNQAASWFLGEKPFYSIGYEFLKKLRDEYMTPDGKQMQPGKDAGALRQEIRIIEIMRALLRKYGYNSGDGFAWNEDL